MHIQSTIHGNIYRLSSRHLARSFLHVEYVAWWFCACNAVRCFCTNVEKYKGHLCNCKAINDNCTDAVIMKCVRKIFSLVEKQSYFDRKSLSPSLSLLPPSLTKLHLNFFLISDVSTPTSKIIPEEWHEIYARFSKLYCHKFAPNPKFWKHED